MCIGDNQAGVNKVVSDAEKLRSTINQSVGGGLSGIKEEIGSLQNRLFSFSGLLHVGFGAEAGRNIFHELHEGIAEFAGGMIEGMKAGEDFFTSVGDGAAKLLGLKTNLEQVREQATKYAADMKAISDASGAIRQDLEGKPDAKFPFLKTGARDESELNKLREASNKAAEDAKEATDALLAIAHRR
jgi:hypothetical protein